MCYAFISIATSNLFALAMLGVVVAGAQGRPADFPEVSKLPSQPGLPDPLVMFDGERVADKEHWIRKRRPELKALFQHYMYGYMPDPPAWATEARVTPTIDREDGRFFDGKATKKEVTISFGPPDCPKIHLLLVIPNARKGPAPVFLGMNFCGNHALVKDSGFGRPGVALPTAWIYSHYPGVKDNHATEAGRGTQIDVWAIEQSIDRGYAVATFYSGDIDPDRPVVREGIQPHFPPHPSPSPPGGEGGVRGPGPHDWGTIAAWAWGLQRAVDYLQTDKAIDRRRIAVVGHSRLGKTALLAGAFDERIALVIPHQAGCGGTAPSRGKVGESVKQINNGFPHWFNGAFKEFNTQPDRLPFDQNCLTALVAPRPVLFSNAVEDTWANPEGQFQVLQATDPVYRFLGVEGLGAKQMPEPGKLLDSRLGYYIRPGKHSMTKEDWKIFLDFADKHLGKPADSK
jgi:hypothetical protein